MTLCGTAPPDLVVQTVPAVRPLPALPMSWWAEALGGENEGPPLSQVVVRPMLCEMGPFESGLAVAAQSVIEALRVWSAEVAGLRVTVIGGDTSERRLIHAWARLGYTTVASQVGWRLQNLSDATMWRLMDVPELELLRLPTLCFEPHILVCVAQLGTHPTERMVGCLATLLGCLPDATRPDHRPRGPELAASLLRSWSPDVCVLDARQVRRWDEMDSFDVSVLERIIVGRDPLAVDVAAARLLGLRPAEVPLLAGVRRVLRRPWPDIGTVSPLISRPAPSCHFSEARLLETVGRLAWQFHYTAEGILHSMNLPRLVGAVRRVQKGQ